MKSNRTSYKRVKINWLIVILFGGIYVWMIFAYIHQWGNNPLGQEQLLFFGLINLALLFFIGRFKVIIDDNFAVFGTDIWIPVKIPFDKIKNVTVERVRWVEINVPGRNIEKYQFDFFVLYAVRIQLKNEMIYQISIKDAQKIKEEIEKRMLTLNEKY